MVFLTLKTSKNPLCMPRKNECKQGWSSFAEPQGAASFSWNLNASVLRSLNSKKVQKIAWTRGGKK
jgi:hypothetical protein